MMRADIQDGGATYRQGRSIFVFVPGSSGTFDVPILQSLVAYFRSVPGSKVVELGIDYGSDVLDLYAESQKRISDYVEELRREEPEGYIVILAKSLGGSLTLWNANSLSIDLLVVLGSTVVLGWPQRISLLTGKNPRIPNYKHEWSERLQSLLIPTLIISGDTDDLADNDYLRGKAEENRNLKVSILKDTDHNLVSLKTKLPLTEQCIQLIARSMKATPR